jgi:hypothetical protein
VNSVWARKWTLADWVYLVNRYASFFGVVLGVAVPANSYEVRIKLFILAVTLLILACTTVLYIEVTILPLSLSLDI